MTWIKVEDKLPEAYDAVLFSSAGYVGIGYYSIATKPPVWRNMLDTDVDGVPAAIKGVTHWMPVPEAP